MDVPVDIDAHHDVDLDDGSGDNDQSVVNNDPETSEKSAAAEVEQVPKNIPDDTPTVNQIEESSIEPALRTEIEGKEGDVVAPTSKEVQNVEKDAIGEKKVVDSPAEEDPNKKQTKENEEMKGEKQLENNRVTKEAMVQKKEDSDASIINNPNDVSDDAADKHPPLQSSIEDERKMSIGVSVAKEVISGDQSEQKEVHSELLIKKTVTNDEEALNETQVYSDVALSPPRKVPTIVSSSYLSSEDEDEDDDDKEDEESSSGEEDSSSEEDDSSSEEEISMTVEEKLAIQQKARLAMQQKAKVGRKLTSTAVAKGGAVISTKTEHNRSANAAINNLRLLARRRSDDDESSSEEEESSSEEEESGDEESSSEEEEEESSSEEEISKSKGQKRRPLPKQSGVAKAPLTETTNYLNPISSMFGWSSTAAKPEVVSTPKPAATASPKRSPKKEGVYVNPVSAMFGWTSSTTKPPTVVPSPRKSARAASAVPVKPAPQSKEEDESSSESESSYESGEEEDDSSDESEEESNSDYKVRTNIPNRKGQAKSPRMEDMLNSLPDSARKSYANSDKGIQHDSVRSRGAALLALAETIPNRPHSPVTVLRRSKAGSKSQSPNAASATTSVHPSAAFQQTHNEMIKVGTDGLEQSREHMAQDEKDSSDSDDESSEEGSTEESSSEEDSEESSEEEDKEEEAKSSAAALFRRQSAEAAAAKAVKRENPKKSGVKNVAKARRNQTSTNDKATHDQQEKSWLVGATDWLAEKRKERQELELKREKEEQVKILRQAIRKKKKYSIKAEQQKLRLLKKWEQDEKQRKQEEEKKKQSKKNLKQTLLESESESESESSSEEEDSSSDEASSSSSDEDEEDDESEEESDDSEGENDTEKVIPDVQIEAEPKDFPYMLGKDMINEMAANFPETVKFSRWKRLYSVAQHQHSFDAMFRSTQDNQNTLVIVRSKKNHVFGGFVDCAWETANNRNFTGPGGGQFYGTDEAFLFRIESSSDEETKHRKDNLVVFKSTGKNRYIQLCDILQKKICMGGEEGGRFGLCLEDDFKHGSTASCDTFGNKPLAPEEQFQIEDVEIWGFESSAS